ncbi:hypothetical protein PPROV_000467000 [Pycnococcus provasolii]|uniref:Uncharacterized protein n=1 Tax=Pycnococcus provasolii TaxID=41880 RepID=A0A830HHA4_9CHLO|nr:hypothetical protein PPROV_000467000 [Pycnococcus provasolii]
MEDIASTIISRLRLDDRASPFELRALGRDYAHPAYTSHRPQNCDVLKVTAPVKDGKLVFKLSYLNNHDRTYDFEGTRRYRTGWRTITYEKDDWEGAVAFVDAFMSDGCRSEGLSLYDKLDSRLDSTTSSVLPIAIGSWNVSGRLSDEVRIVRIRGAFKALLARSD